MNAIVKQAIEHWPYVAPLLNPPQNDTDFTALVNTLDALLDQVGDDESNPLMSLLHHLGDLVSVYEQKNRPMPLNTGASALAFLMQQHHLAQADLADIAQQSVISEILRGKRQLNVRHIRALSQRFGVSPNTFFAAETISNR